MRQVARGGLSRRRAVPYLVRMRKLHNKMLHGAIGSLALLAMGGSLAAAQAGDVAELPPVATAPTISADDADLPRFEASSEAELAAPELLEDMGSGTASWYGKQFAGNRTASGEPFNPQELTAAHRTLPFGSKVRVTLEGSDRSVVVRINDRGPFGHGRIIDVSQAAAQELGLVSAGSGKVRLQRIVS